MAANGKMDSNRKTAIIVGVLFIVATVTSIMIKIINPRTEPGRRAWRTRKSYRWPGGDNLAGRINGAYWPKWRSAGTVRWARYYDGKVCIRPC